MDSGQILLLILISGLIPGVIPQSIIKFSPENKIPTHLNLNRKILRDDLLFCKSWKFTVEANDANPWKQVPEKCTDFVKDYLTGDQFVSDSSLVADNSLAFAKTVEIAGDRKDIWIFDIDETLLSNLPYYAVHGFGTELFDETTFNEWVDLVECPALPASLRLYNELRRLGFTIILLTGRDEHQRNGTVKNLISVGYQEWERLILRGPSDHGKTAVIYKSEKRMELETEGYRIHGSSGDQWSDLYGSPIATRSFKLPNPMYYIA
ncbi:Acid phosphatase [Thalictrum thalictroides]|uniref:Acid phosphatase n=1 Tax=Thalictrum thalictroides TaxID=46969 RepID=A0A7J6WXG9_THATH|nr:Acid phosphatase [Thalictrum thalictroides]